MEPVLGKEKILLLERNHLGLGERVGFVCDFHAKGPVASPRLPRGLGKSKKRGPCLLPCPVGFTILVLLSVLWGPGLEQIFVLSDELVTYTWTFICGLFIYFSQISRVNLVSGT